MDLDPITTRPPGRFNYATLGNETSNLDVSFASTQAEPEPETVANINETGTVPVSLIFDLLGDPETVAKINETGTVPVSLILAEVERRGLLKASPTEPRPEASGPVEVQTQPDQPKPTSEAPMTSSALDRDDPLRDRVKAMLAVKGMTVLAFSRKCHGKAKAQVIRNWLAPIHMTLPAAAAEVVESVLATMGE